ncbi:MAG: acyl-CoA dehydratase activase [Sporomusaceae bacterium]|nr:acyl-CoA dehydratase activase [Sporomusaceae bacterium]
MNKYFVGIDSGSTMCKAVLLQEGILDYESVKTGWNPKLSAAEILELLLKRNNLRRNNVYVAATGYGREAIDFADHTFTEITAHAFGAMFLVPNISGVIDIGGQDSKVIQIQDKKVSNFLMNDKCAAGTGRFLSMACETLEIALTEIDRFANLAEAVTINSMCTVFAESEIIGLLSLQKDRSQIMSGVLFSIAQKVKQMTGKLDFKENLPLLMTGGLSRSQALLKVIAQTTALEVFTHESALFAGAVGACVCASNKIGDKAR